MAARKRSKRPVLICSHPMGSRLDVVIPPDNRTVDYDYGAEKWFQKRVVPPLPKTCESDEEVKKVSAVSDPAVMEQEPYPIGVLYETIMRASRDHYTVKQIRGVLVLRPLNGSEEHKIDKLRLRPFTRMATTKDGVLKEQRCTVQASYRDQAAALLGIYSTLRFWAATEARMETVVRMIERMKPFGEPVVKVAGQKSEGGGSKKELSAEAMQRKVERGNIKALMDAINATLR